MSDVTSILSAIEQGEPRAAAELLPLGCASWQRPRWRTTWRGEIAGDHRFAPRAMPLRLGAERRQVDDREIRDVRAERVVHTLTFDQLSLAHRLGGRGFVQRTRQPS